MGLFDNLSKAASSVVTTVSRAGSSAISTASRTASGAISGASSTISNTFSSVGRGVSSIASGANPIGQAINSATKNTSSSLSGILSNALKQVDTATKKVSTAVFQASKAASEASAGLSSISNLALPGGAVLGSTYALVSGASDSIATAQKAVDDAIKAGGSVSSSVLNQIESAKKQVASIQKQIKTATDTTAKSILNAAESTTSGKVNLANLATGLAVTPVTAPLGIAAIASTVGNSIASALTGGNSTSKSFGISDWFNLDYGNENVGFTDLKTGESLGFLGQTAKPYAADDNFVWFDTGKENVKPGLSGWTNTPDAGKITDYGLSGHVQYSSRELDAGERSHVTEIYKNHGWLSESSKKIGTGLSSSYAGSYVLDKSSDDGGIFGGISSALSGLFSGGTSQITKIASSGNVIDTVVETRDNMIVGGAVNVLSGDDVAGGAVTAGSAMVVDVIAPLDLMNAANKVATGRGNELTLEDWGWAAFDAGLLGLGIVTGGLGYVGGKGLKTALKTGKNAAKIADTGNAVKGLTNISGAVKATEGVEEMANYGRIGKNIKTAFKLGGESAGVDKTLIKQSDNIASGGKAVEEVLKTGDAGSGALKTTKTKSALNTLKAGLIGGALGVGGLSVYSALTGGNDTETSKATGQTDVNQMTGENTGTAGTQDQGYLQNQIDEIVSFLNDAFSGSSTAGTSTGGDSGGYGSGTSGDAGIVENAVSAVENVPVIGDIIKALADRGLLVPVIVGGIILAGIAYYLKSSKKTTSGRSKPAARKSSKKRGAAA